MEFVNFETTNNDCNRRFDTLIRKFLPEMPLSLVYKNIRTGFIRLNDKKTKQETPFGCVRRVSSRSDKPAKSRW